MRDQEGPASAEEMVATLTTAREALAEARRHFESHRASVANQLYGPAVARFVIRSFDNYAAKIEAAQALVNAEP